MYKIIDFKSKKTVSTDRLIFTGEDVPWEIVMDLSEAKDKLNLDYFSSQPPCLSKYLPLMPIKHPAQFVSLKENATPLIKSTSLGKRLGINLLFKVEGKNPTGSFKDRGSAVDVTVAKEFQAPGIVLASTGNMAASCACYAAAAKLPCYVIVPEGVPISKLAQVISFGGKVIQVKGTYNDAARLAYDIAEHHGFYLAGDYAYRVEGQKTAVFEIIDQLRLQTPDYIIIPIGCGTNITAYGKGISEYKALGLIDETPKLIGIQAQGARSVVDSFCDQRDFIIPQTDVATIASAIAVPNPIDGMKALDAIYRTQGEAFAVTDEDILRAQYELSIEEGLFVESASASTVAYVLKNHKKLQGQTIICVLTGDGLKEPNNIIEAAIKPPTIYANLDDFNNLYANAYFNGKIVLFSDRKKVLFNELPTPQQLTKTVIDLFGIKLSDKKLSLSLELIEGIIKKGKTISVLDLQDIIQASMENIENPKNAVFSVIDFKVFTSKDQQAQASVIVNIDNDVTAAGESSGAGPVDAIIKALLKACHGRVAFKLTNYKVDIRNHGSNQTDSVVMVEVTLAKDHSSSSGLGVSSDIIQASLEAFENAYNSFDLLHEE